MIWILMYAGAILVLCGAFVYLTTRVAKFHCVSIAGGGQRINELILAGLINGLLFAVLLFSIHYFNTVIVILHLVFFWFLCDLGEKWIEKRRSHQSKIYCAGIIAILITVVYFSFSAYQAFHVWEKDYQLTTEKEIGSLRAVMLGDAHVGVTFDGDGFAAHLKKIEAVNPDVVFVVGDLVDDDTSRSDMEKTCAALGALKTKYGVYYISGNHEPAYFGTEKRGYSMDDLNACLKEKGVNVLCDETVLIDNRFYVIGRQDKSNGKLVGGRKTMEELTEKLDSSKYSIVLDHQPADYEAQAAVGVDLVLSGHTHGGQLFPFNHVGEWIGQNDLSYGRIEIGKTTFIVTSGIGDWQLYFKSGCRSEFVVMDIRQKP